MTEAERQQVIDALRFAEDVINADDYSLTLIYAALAIMRREREPVAWRDPSNVCPGQGCTYKKEVHVKWPHIFKEPLYKD